MANRLHMAALILLGTVLQTGCTVCRYAQLISVDEPKQYCTKLDREVSLATYRSLADEAWGASQSCCPEDCTESDFLWGFREGFAQYVYAGGNGEPPALPPRVYWQTDMRTAAGSAAAQSWFEGYRVGARVARDGGYRRTATVTASASVRDCDACGCPEGTETAGLYDGSQLTSPVKTEGDFKPLSGPEYLSPQPVPAKNAETPAQPELVSPGTIELSAPTETQSEEPPIKTLDPIEKLLLREPQATSNAAREARSLSRIQLSKRSTTYDTQRPGTVSRKAARQLFIPVTR